MPVSRCSIAGDAAASCADRLPLGDLAGVVEHRDQAVLDEIGGGAGQRAVEDGDLAARRECARSAIALVERRDEEQPAAGAARAGATGAGAEAVGVGLDDGGARAPARAAPRSSRQFVDDRAEVDLENGAAARRVGSRLLPATTARYAAAGVSQPPPGRRSGPMKLSNFVVSASKCSFTLPIGPWRCLAMMISAVP